MKRTPQRSNGLIDRPPASISGRSSVPIMIGIDGP